MFWNRDKEIEKLKVRVYQLEAEVSVADVIIARKDAELTKLSKEYSQHTELRADIMALSHVVSRTQTAEEAINTLVQKLMKFHEEPEVKETK